MTTKKGIYTGLSTLVVASSLMLYYFTFLHDAKKIEPPLSVQIPFDTLSFQVGEGINYHHFTGSNVKIPKNAFVDENGFPIMGEVSVLYREFHSPEEIFLSGIPMGKINDGENPALQSAGMFEVKAFQNENELNLCDGKNISVELAAYGASNDYNIFQLDENNRWNEMGTPEQKDNEKKQKDLAAISDLPDKPKGPIIIDIDAYYKEYLDLAPFKNYRWALADVSENKDFLENQWAFRVSWDGMKVQTVDKAKKLYKLTTRVEMRDYENKTVSKKYSVIVTPVLTGADEQQAFADFNKKVDEYNLLAEQIRKEEERLALEADMLNAFNIDQMGIWNIDKFMNQQQFVKIKADFDFTAQINPYINKVKVYVVNQTDNTVQDYSVRDWDKIYLRTGSSTSIIAVLPDNKIAVFGKNEFSKVDFQRISNGTREYFFDTKIYSAQLQDQEGLKGIL